jgi:4-oxalocrotonate tautomerase
MKANIAVSKRAIRMPFVEIHYLEGKTQEQKEKLAKAITDAVTTIFEVPSDVVWIQFDEMSKTDFATGGLMRGKR